MLRVWSDVGLLMAADTRQVTLLCLLDLSAAFDCVDPRVRAIAQVSKISIATYVILIHQPCVTDGQTDGRTDGKQSQYRALHYSASRGNK